VISLRIRALLLYSSLIVKATAEVAHFSHHLGIIASGWKSRSRPHLRRGHIRQQARGPPHSERKRILIDPMWVNYVPLDDASITPAPQITVRMVPTPCR
jgi:hypothetical protein